MKRLAAILALLAALLPAAGRPSVSSPGVPAPRWGYLRETPPEPPPAAILRHRRVAERRAGTAVIVHRGAASFAPENTLEAYAAAMDYGADGCEVDVRRTADGVLVLFHDDMLDHLTSGFGTVAQVTYSALLSLTPQFRYGTATSKTRPPTFAALLTLARQRAMLLHLDTKEPGLDAEIGRMLEAADAWDHVVGVNAATAPALAKDARVRPLAYKGPGLFEGRRDVDPDAVRAQLARPGQAIMVDDPRVAARELGRPAYRPVPLPEGLRDRWPLMTTGYQPSDRDAPPFAFLNMRDATLPEFEDEDPTWYLCFCLLSGSRVERSQVDAAPQYLRWRTGRLAERAWAAQRLGERGWKAAPRPRRVRYDPQEVERRLARLEERLEGDPQTETWPAERILEIITVEELLEYQVWRRTLHRDWMFHGLDGAMAARALGRRGCVGSVPILIHAFRRVDPELKKVQNPQFGPHPLAWTDFRLKMYVLPALGELPCEAGKRFLQEYLAMSDADARELGPLMREEGARALLRQDLTRQEIEGLLRSPHSAARGTAILECLDHPSRRRTAALRAAAPWALALPRARE